MPNSSESMNCSLLASSVHGIFQARILEWVPISFSRESSWPRDQTHISWVSYGFFTTVLPRKPKWQYWSGLPFPSARGLSDPGTEPRFPALQVGSLLFEPPGKPVSKTAYTISPYKNQTQVQAIAMVLHCWMKNYLPPSLACFLYPEPGLSCILWFLEQGDYIIFLSSRMLLILSSYFMVNFVEGPNKWSSCSFWLRIQTSG